MANQKETPQKNDSIEFTLKVKAGRKKDWLEFALDLNPNDRLISISESFSSRDELNKIFKQILKELEFIDQRTDDYSNATEIQKKSQASFTRGYEQNFKPEFGKIDRVIHRHNSPGVSTVSYARSYNGDKQPK